ncbi:hypothetical protein WJX77_004136 [Trebouxia sp. C0004]
MGMLRLTCFRGCAGHEHRREEGHDGSDAQTLRTSTQPTSQIISLATPFEQAAAQRSPPSVPSPGKDFQTVSVQHVEAPVQPPADASAYSSRAQSSELSVKGLQDTQRLGSRKTSCSLLESLRTSQSQAISSDDICLRPHSAMAARTPSRGDSAADATLDQVIAPVLKKQETAPETLPRLPGKAQATAPTELEDPGLPMPGKIPGTPIIQADTIMQTGRSHAPSEVSSSPNGTLYNKLGGPDALEAAVDLFYEKVLADERLKHFFEGTNMMRLVIKQVQFMVYAFGGSAEYKGKDLKAAHFHLVTKHGLNLEHFDLVAGHFQATLMDLKVNQADIEEAMTTLGTVRSSFDPKSYIGYTLPSKLKVKASVLKDPTATDTLANLIPTSRAEEALVRKAGSKGVVMAAVRVFYMRVMSDEILRPFFEDIDLARLKNKLVSFLAYAFGGGVGHQLNFQPKYQGRDLAFMHSHMVEKGLTMDHFDAVLRHFCQTLRQLNMPQSAIDEASINLNKTRAAFQHVIEKANDPKTDPVNFITSDLIANMQGDKAALLAEVQARMVANPEMAKGVGLDPIDPNDPGLNRPVGGSGACPYFSGQAQTPKGRQAANGLCPMSY